MSRQRAAASRAAILLVVLAASPAPSSAFDVVDEARACLARNDPAGAVDRLETAIADVPKERLPAVLVLLKDACEKAADRADSEGKADEARHYRESIKLLGDPAPTRPEPAAIADPEVVPAAAPRPSPGDLARADAAWKAKEYVEAGSLYEKIARAGKLPTQRNDHWAYCRLVAVLKRINDGPKTAAEWADIHAEIDHIRVLSPKNWYGAYLRNAVIERSGSARKPDPKKLVVRGASPDEKPAAGRTKTVASPSPAPRPRAATPVALPVEPEPIEENAPVAAMSQPVPEMGHEGPRVGNWQTYVSANFQVFHDDLELARKVVARAEAARREAARRWTGREPMASWSPRCDVYLYPSAAIFAAETRQPPESPGFSTAGLSGGKVTARMVKLRVDYAKMLDAVLPHEVTHIVLADLFPDRQVPRWADEGMSVLSEPEAEQALRAADLAGPLRTGVLFTPDVLMTTDYPSGAHWSLFYAQSVSMTRFLVDRGTPPQFVQFVKMSQKAGADAALRKVYKIDGVADLESKWKGHAQETMRVATRSPGDPADGVKRR